MSDQNDKPASWKKVDSLLRSEATPAMPVALNNREALESIPDEANKIREERLDLFGRLKANGIERKMGLEKMRALYEAELEVGKHRLKRAVDVEKQRVDLVANKYLYRITEEYLRDMRDLGLGNYDARMKTLFTLNEQTTRLLEDAEAQNVPQSIKDMTIDAIVAKHKEFYKRIIGEEIQLDERPANS